MKVGDKVIRLLCGTPMPLKVTKITKSKIICGDYEFDKKTGFEIDKELSMEARAESYLVEVNLQWQLKIINKTIKILKDIK
jgi:hypothetical protein